MNNQIPADKVRKLAARFRQQMEPHVSVAECVVWDRAAEAVEALLPAPATLADMTPEERAACRWMLCDVTGFQGQWVLATTCDDDDDAGLVSSCGEVVWSSLARVTPRPDLPRMAWPGDTPAPAPIAPEDYPPPVRVGDTIESADDPRLAALPVGSILLDRDDEATVKRNEAWNGPGYTPIPEEGDEFGPWTVRRIGWEADQ